MDALALSGAGQPCTSDVVCEGPLLCVPAFPQVCLCRAAIGGSDVLIMGGSGGVFTGRSTGFALPPTLTLRRIIFFGFPQGACARAIKSMYHTVATDGPFWQSPCHFMAFHCVIPPVSALKQHLYLVPLLDVVSSRWLEPPPSVLHFSPALWTDRFERLRGSVMPAKPRQLVEHLPASQAYEVLVVRVVAEQPVVVVKPVCPFTPHRALSPCGIGPGTTSRAVPSASRYT